MVQLSDLRSALAAEPSSAPLPADVEEVVRGLQKMLVTVTTYGRVELDFEVTSKAAILLRAQAAAIAEQAAEAASLRKGLINCGRLVERLTHEIAALTIGEKL